jgi:hypothetical protein
MLLIWLSTLAAPRGSGRVWRFIAGGFAVAIAVGCTPPQDPDRPVTLRPTAGSLPGPMRFRAEDTSGVAPGHFFTDLKISANGRDGWAFASGVLIRLQDGRWEQDAVSSALVKDLQSAVMWFNRKGTIGWLFGAQTVLRYADGRWARDAAASQSLPDTTSPYAFGICNIGQPFFEPSGERGFVECRGAASFVNGRLGTSVAGLQRLWVAPTLEHGWAFALDAVYRLKEGGWTRDDAAARVFENEFYALPETVMLDDDASAGWAFSMYGAYRYQNGSWASEPSLCTDTKLCSPGIRLWRDETGNATWATTAEGAFYRYVNSAWTKDEIASTLSERRNIAAVAIDASGSGWAVTNDGIFLRRTPSEWTRDDVASGLVNGNTLGALWLNDSAEEGWAFGSTVIRYTGGKWRRDAGASSQTAEAAPAAVWMDRGGRQGWALGHGVVLRYSEGRWQKHESSANGGPTNGSPGGQNALAFSETGDLGWAAGYTGTVFRFANGAWAHATDASQASQGKELHAVWTDATGRNGWAVGESGVMVQITEGVWRRDDRSSLASGGRTLRAIWLDDQRQQGWCVGDGVVLRFTGGDWSVHEQGTGVASSLAGSLVSLWLHSKGTWGWAAGNTVAGGTLLRLNEDKWVAERNETLASSALSSVRFDRTGQRGWVVGNFRVIEASAADVAGVTMSSAIATLEGRSSIVFDTPPVDVQVEFLRDDQTLLVPDDGQHYTLAKSGERSYTLAFDSITRALAGAHAGETLLVRLKAGFGDNEAPTVVTFVPESPLWVIAPPKWLSWGQRAIALLAAVFALNIAVLLGAVYSPLLRRLVLDAKIRSVLGVGLFRYLLTEPLLVYVPAVHRSIFRDYRRNLTRTPPLEQWDRKQYMHRHFSVERPLAATAPPLDVQSVQELFAHICAHQDRSLFLVEARSGAGKSALLQQIARAALADGRTPLLVDLSGPARADDEIAALMAEHGDVRLSSDAVLTLIDTGGFVMLLDGLNEDRHAPHTLEVLRRAVKRNVVVVASQWCPGWLADRFTVARVALGAFDDRELSAVLTPHWAGLLLDTPSLSGVTSLPLSILLLRDFISRRNQLPGNEYELYHDLSRTLPPSTSVLLIEHAWTMFRRNDHEFEPEVASVALYEQAVDARVLTRGTRIGGGNYRFAHERIQMFFAAGSAVARSERGLAALLKEVDASVSKQSWADLIEFMAYMVLESSATSARYTGLLREAGEFVPALFRKRLYPQYVSYKAAGRVHDPDFESWASGFVAGFAASP